MPESRPEGGAAAGGALLVLVPDEAVPLGTRAAGELSVAFLRAAVTSVVVVWWIVFRLSTSQRKFEKHEPAALRIFAKSTRPHQSD